MPSQVYAASTCTDADTHANTRSLEIIGGSCARSLDVFFYAPSHSMPHTGGVDYEDIRKIEKANAIHVAAIAIVMV